MAGRLRATDHHGLRTTMIHRPRPTTTTTVGDFASAVAERNSHEARLHYSILLRAPRANLARPWPGEIDTMLGSIMTFYFARLVFICLGRGRAKWIQAPLSAPRWELRGLGPKLKQGLIRIWYIIDPATHLASRGAKSVKTGLGPI